MASLRMPEWPAICKKPARKACWPCLSRKPRMHVSLFHWNARRKCREDSSDSSMHVEYKVRQVAISPGQLVPDADQIRNIARSALAEQPPHTELGCPSAMKPCLRVRFADHSESAPHVMVCNMRLTTSSSRSPRPRHRWSASRLRPNTSIFRSGRVECPTAHAGSSALIPLSRRHALTAR